MYKTKPMSSILIGNVVRATNSCGAAYSEGSLYVVRDYHIENGGYTIFTILDDKGSETNGWASRNFELLATKAVPSTIVGEIDVVCVSINGKYSKDPEIGKIYRVKKANLMGYLQEVDGICYRKEDFRLLIKKDKEKSEETPKTLELEVGKTYINRIGQHVTIITKSAAAGEWPYIDSMKRSYTALGGYNPNPELEDNQDLVEEVDAPKEEFGPLMADLCHKMWENHKEDFIRVENGDAVAFNPSLKDYNKGNNMEDTLKIEVNGKKIELGSNAKAAKVKSDFKKKAKVIGLYYKKEDNSFVKEVKFDTRKAAEESLSVSENIDYKMAIYEYGETLQVALPVVSSKKTKK